MTVVYNKVPMDLGV